MVLTSFLEKLNKVDGNIYVIEESVDLKDGVYSGTLEHDNINPMTLTVHTGPKLTGDRIETYALSTPSLTPWKREIRIYADVPRVYISYECDGDTVEAEDINKVQAAVNQTQKSLNEEESRAKDAEKELGKVIQDETDRAIAEEQQLDEKVNEERYRAENAEKALSDDLEAETARATKAEKKLTDDLSDEITRAAGAEATLTENLSAEAARATEAEQKLTTDLSAEVIRSKAVEKTLTDNLSAEISRATGAEKILTDNLASETTRATGAEKTLTSNLNAEVTRAKAAEKANADNITTELNRATAKESELQGSIQTETTRAQAAEKTLTDHLSAEVTRAKAAEKTNADNLTAEVTRSKGAEKTLTDNLAAEVTRAKAAEKTNSDSVSAEVTRATAAENDIRSTISTNKPNWDDKYTKNEVDNKFSALETAIDWKEAVNTFADLSTTYPHPDDGWTVNVKDTDYTYRWSGTAWIAISANAIPKATQSVDGLLSKEDKAALDDTNAKKHTHSNKSTLDKLTETLLANWTEAYNKRHEHGNKAVIDKITQALLDDWTVAYTHISNTVKHITADERTNWNDANGKKHTHANKSIIDKLTQAMLDKLSGIAAGAEVNVQADWNVVDENSDAYIKNKPIAMPASDVLAWAKAANKPAYSWSEITSKPNTFPPSSHNHTKNQITDMPTKVSQFTNDTGYITQKDVDTSQNHTHSNKTVLDKITQTMLDKLAGIAEGANKYVHPTTAGNKHIPAGGASGQFLKWSADGTAVWAADNNTTYSAFKAATASAAGGAGLVPAPAAGAQAKYLRADGSWQTPPDTKYSHPNSGVVAGTYQNVTVNTQGHVTGGTPQGPFTWNQVHGAYTWDQLKGV